MYHDSLSDPQQRALDAVGAFVQEHGFSPSVRDVADACGWKSASTAQVYLDQLEQQGFIKRARRRGRAIQLVSPPPESI